MELSEERNALFLFEPRSNPTGINQIDLKMVFWIGLRFFYVHYLFVWYYLFLLFFIELVSVMN